MTRAEREAFLSETRVAVISVEDPGRGPLAVPVWYRYEPGGDLFFVTGKASLKAQSIAAAGRLSLLVQTEIPPYRYVSVEGRAVLEGVPDYEQDVRAVATRYLGEAAAKQYLKSTGGEAAREASVLVRLTPERWRTVDYGKPS